jgi:hypothetical protein
MSNPTSLSHLSTSVDNRLNRQRQQRSQLHHTSSKQQLIRRQQNNDNQQIQHSFTTHTRPLPTSSALLFPKSRPGRHRWETPIDQNPFASYGDSIQQKAPGTIRVFFQNVKGLTFTTGLEDYYYYIQGLTAFQIDIAGLSETNTAWQHLHLQSDFRQQLRKHYNLSKVHYGYPTKDIDPCTDCSTYQPGGNLTLVNGNMTSSSYGDMIEDPTGLGRWSGISFRGKDHFLLTTITAYRTCGGNARTAPLGSTYSREYHYFRDRGHKQPQPRRLFLHHLETAIKNSNMQGTLLF